jgi:hypothetical protein
MFAIFQSPTGGTGIRPNTNIIIIPNAIHQQGALVYYQEDALVTYI